MVILFFTKSAFTLGVPSDEIVSKREGRLRRDQMTCLRRRVMAAMLGIVPRSYLKVLSPLVVDQQAHCQLTLMIESKRRALLSNLRGCRLLSSWWISSRPMKGLDVRVWSR